MEPSESNPAIATEQGAPSDELAHATPEALARQASLRKDHLLDIRRARLLGYVGAAAWPFFVLYDVVQTQMLHDGSFAALFSLRVLGEALLLGALVVLRRDPPITEAQFHRLVTLTVYSVSGILAGMCVATDGLASIYVAGNMFAGVALVFAPQPFKQALRTIAFSLSAHPFVLSLAAIGSPTIRAQSHDPAVVGRLIQYGICAVFLGTALAGFSHLFYGMRNRLHESRGIGRYRFRRKLGAGGSSEVWAAYHVGLEREVALKVLEPSLEHRADEQRRFLREVRATTRLTHPNTIRIYDYGVTEEGVLFYAMELLEGENLGQLVARGGALPPGRAVHLVRQAARSLAEAHARRLVHRDVKPENLFLCEAGLERDFVKLLDFGIATQPADEAAGSEGEEVVGTPMAMSPEVIRGLRATAASDVYGMGVVLYYLLTGTYPFRDGNSSTILAAHVANPPTPPSVRLGRELPPALEALVLRCLAKDPAERPRDGRALATALAALKAELPWDPAAEIVAELATPNPFRESVTPGASQKTQRVSRKPSAVPS